MYIKTVSVAYGPVIHYPFEAEEREREMGTIDEEEIQR
jgi:hypothetical protein